MFQESPGNWVYCWMNTTTKRCYVGQTTRTLTQRLASHWKDSHQDKKRPSYRYIDKLGFHRWIILPLQQACCVHGLDAAERHWMHQLRNLVINDPHTWYIYPKKGTRNRRNPQAPCDHHAQTSRLQQRIQMDPTLRHLSQRVRCLQRGIVSQEYRRKVHVVIHSSKWHTWSTSTLLELLINIRIAKLSTYKQRQVTHYVRSYLKKARNVDIKSSYPCKLLTCKHLDKSAVRRWLSNILHRSIDNHLLAKYISTHLDIVLQKDKTLQSMIGNVKRVLQTPDDELHCPCAISTLPKSNGHVHLKASDLPTSHQELKQLLARSMKNPIRFNNNEYMAIQFRKVHRFLQSFNTTYEIHAHEEEQWKNIVWRPDQSTTNRFDKTTIRSILHGYRYLCFSPLDKNSNTWCVSCPVYMKQRTLDMFQDTTHYRPVTEADPDTLKLWIQNGYNERGLPSFQDNGNGTLEPRTVFQKTKTSLASDQ